jgi:hypothetical protein
MRFCYPITRSETIWSWRLAFRRVSDMARVPAQRRLSGISSASYFREIGTGQGIVGDRLHVGAGHGLHPCLITTIEHSMNAMTVMKLRLGN